MTSICKSRGQQVILTSVPDRIKSLLVECSHYYDEIEKQNLIFPKTEMALRFLGVPIK